MPAFFTADTHNDALLRLTREDPVPRGQISYEKLTGGAPKLICFALYVSQTEKYAHSCLQEALLLADRFFAMAEKCGFAQVTEPAQVDVQQPGKLHALLTLEGGDALENEPANLRILHRLGVRMATLTWSNDNALACGCATANDTGLTPLGRAMVAQMEKLRILPDVSHLSDRSFWDVMEAAKGPVMASHSDARALCPSVKRNLTDEMLRALAQRGGFVGVNAVPSFLTESKEPARIEDMVRHIEHIANVMGLDKVGLGTDFDGIDHGPVGFEDCGCYPALAQALLARCYTADEVAGVMGQNFLRFWERAITR